MLKRFLCLFSMLILSCSFAFAEVSSGAFSLAGYLKNEASIRLSNSDLTKFKNIAELSGEYDIDGEDLVFFVKAKYWYDAMYDWRSEFDAGQDTMWHIQRSDWLRDCYFDITKGSWFLRLGKQQVAWGQADGITILDRVNPVDLTEYWLGDMADIRIPLWMANINYSPKLNSNIQLLIIPDFEQSTAAPDAAPFAFRSLKLFEIYKTRKRMVGNSRADTDIYYPGTQLKNSTFALQWSDRIGDLDYTLNFLSGYYYSARTYLLSSGASAPSTTPFVAHYGRMFNYWRMYGASFNKTFTNPSPLQGITFRGDFAYYNDEPTYYGTPLTGTTYGVNRWDNVFWLIGMDKAIFTNWLVSFQFSQYIMQDAKPGFVGYDTMNAYTYGPSDQVENIFTLKVSTDFLHERLKPEILWSCTDDNQGRLSPKITYEINDNLWFTAGIHYFYGSEWDSNGQFIEQSQFYTSMKYTF
jgi:hypothetical protein